MNYKVFKVASVAVLTVLLAFFSTTAQEKNDKFRIVYNEKADRTTVFLNGIELPKNKDSFSVGGSIQFEGKTTDKMPCCAVLFFTSMSKKNFKFEENHTLKIWAD